MLSQETRRRRFIEYWRDCLGEYHAPPVEESIPGGELDFRVVLGKTSALLEWKPAGNAEFETPKPAFLRQMLLASAPALSHLSPEAETIWQAFAGKVANHLGSAELSYGLEDEKAALGRLLSRPALASRILGLERLPLKRVSEPLHWDLMEPADGQPDTACACSRPTGTPCPSFSSTLAATPSSM